MCGRFVQTSDPFDYAEILGIGDVRVPDDLEGPVANPNVAPTETVAAAVRWEGTDALTALRWGLVPPWAKDPRTSFINARAETAATKPAFRTSVERRRCVIPADAFYEWRRDGARKVPFAIRDATGFPLRFAAIWTVWRAPEDDRRLRSCAILTMAARPPIRPVHDRQPVALTAEGMEAWLSGDAMPLDLVHDPEATLPDDHWMLYRVSTRVNDARNKDPDLPDPVDDARYLTPEGPAEPPDGPS